VSTGLIVTLFGGLAACWAVQGWLVMRQTKRFNAHLSGLRKAGLTAVGRGGSRMRGFAYVALAANRDGRVTAAEAMSGVTVFARLRPAPEFVGRDVRELSAVDEKGARAQAAAQAAEALLNAPQDVWERRAAASNVADRSAAQ
jgi:DNA-binding transcriptional regulator of glucitol operon